MEVIIGMEHACVIIPMATVCYLPSSNPDTQSPKTYALIPVPHSLFLQAIQPPSPAH